MEDKVIKIFLGSIASSSLVLATYVGFSTSNWIPLLVYGCSCAASALVMSIPESYKDD